MLIEMAGLCDGEVIYFSLDSELPSIAEHRARGTGSSKGRRAVIVRDGNILLASGPDEILLASLAGVPLPDGEHAALEIENLLAAVGAAWALGISPALIRTGMKRFARFKR